VHVVVCHVALELAGIERTEVQRTRSSLPTAAPAVPQRARPHRPFRAPRRPSPSSRRETARRRSSRLLRPHPPGSSRSRRGHRMRSRQAVPASRSCSRTLDCANRAHPADGVPERGGPVRLREARSRVARCALRDSRRRPVLVARPDQLLRVVRELQRRPRAGKAIHS
jgi:hypothetical protein